MDRHRRRLLLSASDLVNHANCEYLTGLEFAVTRGAPRPDRTPTPDVHARIVRGFEHEAAFLDALEAEGKSVCRIDTDRSTNAGLLLNAIQTQSALNAGFDVVYQPTFLHERNGVYWQGHGDFAVRTENGTYEIYDTKLARTVKPGVLVQLGLYSEMLAAVQGVVPERFHVVLGSNEVVSYRTAEVLPLVRAFRDRFEADLRAGAFPGQPVPVAHCTVCDWKTACERQWEATGHLSLVRGMRPKWRDALEAAGIDSLQRLALSPPGTRVAQLPPSAFEELQAQARLQVRGQRDEELLFELRPPIADRGLPTLPAPSPADLFLDFEANQLEREPSFAYLFAVVEAANPEAPTVQTYWADAERTERSNIRALARRIAEARALDPEMHVYHWGAFDHSLMRTLMEHHGVAAADLILDAFVDLHAIFRDSGRLSDRSTSLKVAERLWSTETRASAGMDGASSIALREQYLRTRSRTVRQRLRDELTQYCADDTVQLVAARMFLLQQRRELYRQGALPVPPVPVKVRTDRRLQDDLEAPTADRLRTVEAELRALLPEDPEQDAAWDVARRTMADALDWHRRERKPEWREYFERIEMDTRACREDDVALGDLRLRGELSNDEIMQYTVRGLGFDPQRSVIERYTYDWSQDHRLNVGDRVVDPSSRDKEVVEIVDIDTVLGEVILKRSRQKAIVEGMTRAVRNLVPGEPPPVETLQASLLRIAESLRSDGPAQLGPYLLAEQLLRGASPRLRSIGAGEPLVRPREDQAEAVARLVCDLDRSVLAVQGPPGSGKTYAAARAIRAYLAANSSSRPARIGVMASSHSVVGNLLDEVARQAAAHGDAIGIVQLSSSVDTATHPDVRVTKDHAAVARALAMEQVQVVGGTAWFFSRPENTAGFDLLVVDEAGQISLADTVAASPAARNMLLVGDPAQLTQPIRGQHPASVRTSPIGKIIGNHDTMPLDRGVFFTKTRRLGRNCEFISEQFYEGRLQPHRPRNVTKIHGIEQAKGLLFVPVAHQAMNRSASLEEAETVVHLVDRLSGCSIEDAQGHRPVTAADILVISPFNAQAHRIRHMLGSRVRVLTVDKAQGREAPIVIYSMATSDPERSPRGSEFVLSRNRLNVAISRAQGLSIVVASPTVFEPVVRHADEVRRLGAHLRFVEMAGGQSVLPDYAGQLPRLDFAERVRRARSERKMTQRALAAAVGCDARTIGRIEAGETESNVRMAIARVFGWAPEAVVEMLAGQDRTVWDAPSMDALVRSLEPRR